MDRRRVFRNAFLWNALVSALMAGAALYARSGARGWLAAGWCIGVAASAAAVDSSSNEQFGRGAGLLLQSMGRRARRHSGNGLVSSAGGGDVGRCCGDSGIFHGGRAGGHSAAACTGAAPCGGDAVGGTARAQKR